MPRIVGTPQEEIDLTLRTLFKTGQVVELRALDYLRQGCTASGYFSHFGLLAEKALELSGQATGVYVTVHELDPALLARACNRIERFPKAVTSDRDVVRYRFLPVDFDPRRPAGISSTEGEHRAALQRAHACRDWLLEQGFPEPLIADSGNGAHILVRIDLPVDPASRTLVERCLKALAAKFSDGAVLVDTGVANPARIWRLYGTRACKGDPTNDRPHRLAHLLRIPKTIVPLTLDQLQRLASLAPSVSATGGQVQAHSRRLKVADWLTDHDQAFRSKDDGESVIFILKTCPFNESHTDKAHIIQSQSGQLRAGCFHASCQGKGWAEFRDAIGKPDHRHYEGGRLPCPNCLCIGSA